MKHLELQQVHGTLVDSYANIQWNEAQNTLYLSAGSVISVINIRTSNIVKHISASFPDAGIKCFCVTDDYKYLFTVQHHTHTFEPLITCIDLHDDSKYKIMLHNPMQIRQSMQNIQQNDGKSKSRPATSKPSKPNGAHQYNQHSKYQHTWSQYTSCTRQISLQQDKLLMFNQHELYVIHIDFQRMQHVASPAHNHNSAEDQEETNPNTMAKKPKTKSCNDETSIIECDIIAYINTSNYSPNFNDNTPTEIYHAVWLDADKFITAGQRHLSMWKMVETAGMAAYNSNIDIMRQKFKFGKYKNNGNNNHGQEHGDRPMSARIANNNIQFATSPSLRKITFKLGTFTNSCFVCICLGDTEKTKDSLYTITSQGILCTFNIQGRYLQKWVNLRMDKAFYITVRSSIILCCGAPEKTRIFDSDSLKHLGTFPTVSSIERPASNVPSVASSIATVHNAADKQSMPQPLPSNNKDDPSKLTSAISATVINDGKKMINVYNDGTIVVWSLNKVQKDNSQSPQYQFTIFRSIHRNTLSSPKSIVQLANKDVIFHDHSGNLRVISNRNVTTALPPILQSEHTVTHIVTCFDAQYFILIQNHNIANMYTSSPLRLKERINLRELMQDDVHQIRVSPSSQLLAIDAQNSNQVHIMHTLESEHIHSIINMQHKIIDFDFWSDSNGIYILTQHNLCSYSFASNQPSDIFTVDTHPKTPDIHGIQAYPGGKFLICYSLKSIKIKVWNMEQKSISRSYQLPDIPTQVMFDSTGLYLVAVCKDHNIYFIDWFSGQVIYKGAFHVNPIVDMLFSADCNSLITASTDGLIAKWCLPSLITTGMQERKNELCGTHTKILNSFNELKQLQLQLPGGLNINDLLNEEDEDEEEEVDEADQGKEEEEEEPETERAVESPSVITSQEELKQEAVEEEKVENKNPLESDSAFCPVAVNSDDTDIAQNDDVTAEIKKAEEETLEHALLKITVSTPSGTVHENVLKKVEVDVDVDEDEGQMSVVKEEEEKNELLPVVDEPMFIEQSAWKKENIVEHLKKDILQSEEVEFAEDTDVETDNKDPNKLDIEEAAAAHSLSVSATSSIEIPSIQDLLKNESNTEVDGEEETNAKEQLNSTGNGEPINVNMSTEDDLADILKQLKELESKEVLLNAEQLIDVQIVLGPNGSEEKDLSGSATFPIALKIALDTNEFADGVQGKQELEEKPEPETQSSIDSHPRSSPVPVPSVLCNEKEVGSTMSTQSVESSESPKKRKVRNALLGKAQSDSNSDVESEASVKVERLENLIPAEEWEKMKSPQLKQRKAENEQRNAEAELLWNCFERNVASFANGAQQLRDLSVLLKMKGVSKTEMNDKILKNERLKRQLNAIYSSLEWMREIVIDSDYSHTLM